MAAQLISSGHVNHAYIGITAQPVSKSAARLFHLPVSHGLLVAGVQSGSGAAKAGLRAAKQSATLAGETYPLGGDLIASVDGTPLYTIDQLRDAIANKQPGDDVEARCLPGERQEDSDSDIGTAAHDRLTVELAPPPGAWFPAAPFASTERRDRQKEARSLPGPPSLSAESASTFGGGTVSTSLRS